MKNLPVLFMFVIVLAGCNSSNTIAQTKDLSVEKPDTKAVTVVINNFLGKYKNDGTTKAIDYLFNESRPTFGVDNLKSKLDSTRMELGDFTGAEKITEKNVAGGLVLMSYLVKHKYHPIRFTFIFYKPENKWFLYKFYYDTEFMSELQSEGRLHFPN